MHKITAIIPAYNESSRIVKTLTDIKPFVDEIIVIDDSSTDNTSTLARNTGAKVLIHTENKGYIASIKYGFKEADGTVLVVIDADGEFPAEKIPALIKPILEDDVDMVQGHRSDNSRISERFLTWLAQTKANVGDSGSGFRAIRTDLAKELEINGKCICGILSLEVIHKGGRIVEIPINLQQTNKARKIAWFHFSQLFYLIKWLFKKY